MKNILIIGLVLLNSKDINGCLQAGFYEGDSLGSHFMFLEIRKGNQFRMYVRSDNSCYGVGTYECSDSLLILNYDVSYCSNKRSINFCNDTFRVYSDSLGESVVIKNWPFVKDVKFFRNQAKDIRKRASKKTRQKYE